MPELITSALMGSGTCSRDSIVQPDISVIYAADKLDDKRFNGPDWVIEIVSASTACHDYVRKYELYKRTGVRQYWIINPDDKSVVKHRVKGNSTSTGEYTLDYIC